MRDEAKIRKFLKRKKTMLGSMKTGQQSRYKGSKGGILFDDLKMKATDIIHQSLLSPVNETPRIVGNSQHAATSMGLRSSSDTSEDLDKFPVTIDEPQDLCSLEDQKLRELLDKIHDTSILDERNKKM